MATTTSVRWADAEEEAVYKNDDDREEKQRFVSTWLTHIFQYTNRMMVQWVLGPHHKATHVTLGGAEEFAFVPDVLDAKKLLRIPLRGRDKRTNYQLNDLRLFVVQTFKTPEAWDAYAAVMQIQPVVPDVDKDYAHTYPLDEYLDLTKKVWFAGDYKNAVALIELATKLRRAYLQVRNKIVPRAERVPIDDPAVITDLTLFARVAAARVAADE